MGASSVLFAPHLVLRRRSNGVARQTVHQRDMGRMIPKILHYTFGMAPDFGGKPWSLIHHVCLASAVERIRPEKVFFYCQFEPSTPWWDLSRELLTVVKIQAPKEIFGRPLKHVAHQSDVVRLQRLIADGGIYLDADVLVQRSFDDLLEHSTVLGREGEAGEFGVANAVILAEPNAPFLRRWLDEYRSFRSQGRDRYWSEHSVQLPAQLAKAYPDEITVLPPTAFYWPLWTEDHLKWIFRSDEPISLDLTYANHLWESSAWDFVQHLTPGDVRAKSTNFHKWALPFLTGLPDDYGAPTMLERLERIRRSTSKNAQRVIDKTGRRVQNMVRPASRATANSAAQPHDGDKRRQIFQDVYQRNLWGTDGDSKFYSGVGSRGDAAKTYVRQMAELLQRHANELGRVLTVVDLGCGDFEIGRALLERLPDLNYVACDIVPELIAHNQAVHGGSNVQFRQLDIVTDPLPEGDVCLMRQVLQHLSNADIGAFLERANYQWVYVTEGHPAHRTGPVNPDKRTGHDVRFNWRTGRGRGVELNLPPYNLATEDVIRATAPPHATCAQARQRPFPGRFARICSLSGTQHR